MSPEQVNEEVLGLLRSIDRRVSAIEAAMTRASASAAAPAANGNGARAEGTVADARDLDGQYGDPTIKYDPKPKYWSGASFIGYHFSECTPDYLDAQATYLDACAYMAAKDPDETKRRSASFKARDAARARGWAARLRAGYGGGSATRGPVPAAPGDAGGTGAADDDIPFISSRPNAWGL